MEHLDCFSSETVTEFVHRLSAWEDELNRLTSSQSDLEVQFDIALLQKLASTLREQLSEVRTYQFQPGKNLRFNVFSRFLVDNLPKGFYEP